MRSLTRLACLAAVATVATAAAAHGGHHDAHDPLRWTWDPWITAPLALSALLFARGWRILAARTTRGTDDLRRRALAFAAGWVMLAIALVTPLHDAGERSFSAHMTEHELLMLAAAPALAMARPLVILLWAFPTRARQMIGRITNSPVVGAPWDLLTGPVTATLLQAAALWLWHAPALFDLALAHEGWHVVQHLCFIVSALLFWTAMLGRAPARDADAARAIAILCLFATSIVSGALGALMAVSSSPWYAGYARLGMAPFGLTPAEDQQVAGLIMWIPGGLVHAAAALVLMRQLLRRRPAQGAASVR